jgi:hypothetical protein
MSHPHFLIVNNLSKPRIGSALQTYVASFFQNFLPTIGLRSQEGRRRTDLVRWDKYTTGTWWDKTPDKDGHTNIFPIGLNVLGTSPQLVQNPGYQ